jgi:exoribonuclease R
MLLAGEIAAQWCSDRGIPVVYRLTPRNEEIADPAEFFVRNLLPTMDEQGNVDPVQKAIYMSLLGPVQLSTTPGPHMTIGVDMVSRCTSPLRRYPDLLLQWQVESAILEEARLGRSLVGNKREDFLPFTKAQIDVLLPHIDTRERILSGGKRRARQHWLCLFILRAWKFGEARIPSTFPLTVTGQDHIQGLFMGIVSDFRTIATCEYPDWISPEEIKIGDILEVELADINVYHSQLKFKPLRRLDSSESDSLERANLSTVQWLDVR